MYLYLEHYTVLRILIMLAELLKQKPWCYRYASIFNQCPHLFITSICLISFISSFLFQNRKYILTTTNTFVLPMAALPVSPVLNVYIDTCLDLVAVVNLYALSQECNMRYIFIRAEKPQMVDSVILPYFCSAIFFFKLCHRSSVTHL